MPDLPLDLHLIPLFSSLDENELAAVRAVLETQVVTAGTTICRQGDVGKRLYIVAGGGVRVLLSHEGGRRRGELYFGVGNVFGELSLLSEMPVSATVIAARYTILLTLDKAAFTELLLTQPSLYAALTKLLVARVRHRSTLDTQTLLPSCALLIVPDEADDAARALAGTLLRGVRHYAPQSVGVVCLSEPQSTKVKNCSVPEWFPTLGAPFQKLGDDEYAVAVPQSDWLAELISRWREVAAMDQFLVLVLPRAAADELRDKMSDRDAALFICQTNSPPPNRANPQDEAHFGLADCATIRLGSESETRARNRDGAWEYSIAQTQVVDSAAQLNGAQKREWNVLFAPSLALSERVPDRVVRWITRREIGLALGSGSARGFAHLAIIAALENEGIPIDYIAGSSMGGIMAAMYAFTGSAKKAEHIAREYLAANHKVRDMNWFRLPRASLMAGRKVRRQAELLFGDTTLADFYIPIATVASDLILGDRVVIDRGPATEAVLATSAIPGVYPPLVRGEQILADGGIVSQVPADLLLRRRCGLKIAVNVAPAPAATRPTPAEIAAFRGRLERPFGLLGVLERSWDLMAWWYGAADAGCADIFLEPTTDRSAGGSFDSMDQMLELGQRAVEERMDGIREAALLALRPGTP